MLNTKCGDSITCVYSACKHNNNCHLSWMVIDFMMFPYMRLSLLAFQHIISGQLGNMRQWWPQYRADKPIPSQGQVSPVLWIPNIPIIHFVSLETTINLRQTFVGLKGIGKMLKQHSIMDIPQHITPSTAWISWIFWKSGKVWLFEKYCQHSALQSVEAEASFIIW